MLLHAKYYYKNTQLIDKVTRTEESKNTAFQQPDFNILIVLKLFFSKAPFLKPCLPPLIYTDSSDFLYAFILNAICYVLYKIHFFLVAHN